MECIVRNCPNKQHQGVGKVLTTAEGEQVFICLPCFLFLRTGIGGHSHSQLERNGQGTSPISLKKAEELITRAHKWIMERLQEVERPDDTYIASDLYTFLFEMEDGRKEGATGLHSVIDRSDSAIMHKTVLHRKSKGDK